MAGLYFCRWVKRRGDVFAVNTAHCWLTDAGEADDATSLEVVNLRCFAYVGTSTRLGQQHTMYERDSLDAVCIVGDNVGRAVSTGERLNTSFQHDGYQMPWLLCRVIRLHGPTLTVSKFYGPVGLHPTGLSDPQDPNLAPEVDSDIVGLLSWRAYVTHEPLNDGFGYSCLYSPMRGIWEPVTRSVLRAGYGTMKRRRLLEGTGNAPWPTGATSPP